MAFGIFARRFWSHGYGTEAIRLILRYGFEEVKLHRVDLLILEYNTRALRTDEKCGFTREGVRRDSAYIDGAWYDDILMAILEQDFSNLLRSARDPATGAAGHDMVSFG